MKPPSSINLYLLVALLLLELEQWSTGAVKLNQTLPLNNDNKITVVEIYWPHIQRPFIIYSRSLKLAWQRSDKVHSQTLFHASHLFQLSTDGKVHRNEATFQSRGSRLSGWTWTVGGLSRSSPTDHPIISLSFPSQNKDWSRPAAFTAWQHGHGKLCFRRDIRLSIVAPANKSAPGCKKWGVPAAENRGQPCCHVSHSSRFSR